MSAAEDTVLLNPPPVRRGLKKGQRHSGSFGPGFDSRRKGYLHDGKFFAQMAQEHAPECMRLWVAAMGDEDAPWPVRIRASELIVERAYGKSASVIDMQVTHNRPLTALTDEELLRIITAEPERPALTFDGEVADGDVVEGDVTDQDDQETPDLAVPVAVPSENTEENP
jgi:hypothetical protein